MTERCRSKVGLKGKAAVDDLLKELDEVAEDIGKTWPKEASAVKAVREDRKKNS